jgi:protein gp37
LGLTKIEWTDRTWNPVRGCSRVSEGCRNCYAERTAARFSNQVNLGDGSYLADGHGDKKPGLFDQFAIRTPSGPRWTGKVELIESKLTEPFHWKKSQRVFVNSMSDLFHEALPDEAIDRVFAVMALCPLITFQVLTKRPERMFDYFGEEIQRAVEIKTAAQVYGAKKIAEAEFMPWPYRNIWLGVSVEDQATADERIPLLLQTPAAIRFVSYEPALGPVDFTVLQPNREVEIDSLNGRHGVYRPLRGSNEKLDWIIAGGESGPGARPPKPDWFRSVRDQCIAADVPFFFKQWGEWGPFGQASVGMKNALVKIGKKKAGALLDGREWKQFPK